jgi:hypothetical protein
VPRVVGKTPMFANESTAQPRLIREKGGTVDVGKQ